MLLLILPYKTAFDVDLLIRYHFFEFGWIQPAFSYEICVYSSISALVSTFCMFVEEVLVFFELELIVTLDITIFNSFWY